MTVLIMAYLSFNLIVALVSNVFIEFVDKKYWRFGNPAPETFLFMVAMSPQLVLVSKRAGRLYGYLVGYIYAMLVFIHKDRDGSKLSVETAMRYISFIKGVILIMLGTPILIYGVFSQAYWSIRVWYVGRKNDLKSKQK